MRRLLTLFAISALLVGAAACGDDDAAGTDTGGDATPSETPSETPAGTDAGGDATPSETPAPTEGGIGVSLVEFAIDTGTDIDAGTVTFDVMNDGTSPHEFGIARGASYEALPKLANGAIDEDAAAGDILGKTELLGSGESTSVDFDLEPGSYVFFCNVNVGPNSHAAKGQVLSVTVS